MNFGEMVQLSIIILLKMKTCELMVSMRYTAISRRNEFTRSASPKARIDTERMKKGWRGRIIRAVIHELMQLHLPRPIFPARVCTGKLRRCFRSKNDYSSPGGV